MPRLKCLGDEAVLILFTLISVAMLISGTVLDPGGGVPASISLVWIAGVLILLRLFTVSAIELARRFLGGRGGAGSGG